MITLAILEQMASDNLADIVVDTNAFWEQAPLLKDGNPAQGIWLVTRGGDASQSPKGLNLKTTVDFYVAFVNKPKTEDVHKQILQWIIDNPCICELSGSIGGTTYSFTNVRIRPTTTPQNFVVSQNGLVVKMASANIIYDINNIERI